MSRVVTLSLEILSFKQLEKESLRAAWACFTNSLASGPDLGIQEPILLQHFRMGLNVESAKFLDTSSRGSFNQLTPREGKVVLGKILKKPPYKGIYDELLDEEETIQEEPKTDALSKPKPIEEKPIRTIWREEPLLYPRVYPADYSYDFDEESTYSDPLSESEFIEEESILWKFKSTDSHPPLTKTWFIEEPFQPYREFDDFIYEFYDELFVKHWTEKYFSGKERDSNHEGEEVHIPNPEEMKIQREKLEYMSAISSREWLREAEGMDQVIQLYLELKLLSCQVGNLYYQDVIYDPRVRINIIPKSLVLEAFPNKPLSFSQKRLQ